MPRPTFALMLSAFRAGFAEAWSAARSGGGGGGTPGPGALGVLEIDDLPGLTALHGAEFVDRLLRQVEGVLRRALPSGGALQVASPGCLLVELPPLSAPDAAAALERLRRTAADVHIETPGGTMTCTMSATPLEIPEPGDDAARIAAARRALARLTLARALGGRRSARSDAPGFEPSAEDLAAAVASGALGYHVQPIRELATGRIVGLEALLRWTAQDGTAHGPGDIVDALERIPEGLEAMLPDLVERTAAPILARPDLFVSLNITGAVLDGVGSSSCRWLDAVLRQVPPDRLVLEIVETAVIARPERAQELIDRLRTRGVRIALDDFGTGLSNLERLRVVEADVLKVDRAFIAGLGRGGREEIILRHLLRMTDELGMQIVAEGIESAGQARAVSELGIRFGQGYHLGRPAPIEAWADRLGA